MPQHEILCWTRYIGNRVVWLSHRIFFRPYLQSQRARAKVRHWFKYQSFEEHVSQGRTQLDRELHRLGATSLNQEKIAQKLHFNKLENLLAALGRGDVTQRHLVTAIQDEMPARTGEIIKPIVSRSTAARSSPTDILVEGMGNLLTRIAKCCKPMPLDLIVGYVTRDRGVTIHRQDCSFMQHLPENKCHRMLSAQWVSQKALP